MGVHSFHIFDRKGKTLFTKRYAKKDNITDESSSKASKDKSQQQQAEDEEQLEEQRKLVFGMLFSLREVVGSLSAKTDDGDDNDSGSLHSVRTGASTLYNYETASGMRFVLFMSNNPSSSSNLSHASYYSSQIVSNNNGADGGQTTVRGALQYIYTQLWLQCVIRSPLYRPTESDKIQSTNFEQKLDSYLSSQVWYR